MFKRSLIVSFALVICAAGATLTSSAAKAADDVITTFVHARAFNAQFQPVDITPAVILKSQAALIQKLTAAAPQAQKDGVHQLQLMAAPGAGTAEGDKVWANTLAIANLTQNSTSPEAVIARTLNAYFVTTYGSLTNKPVTLDDLDNGVTPTFATQSLKAQAPGANAPQLMATNQIKKDAKTYIQNCQAAGVPTPPPFPGNGWTYMGDLDPSQSFLLPKAKAAATQKQSVYAVMTATGLCVAQPIITTDPKTWAAFGVVCQSVGTGANKNVSTSKSCFWDNNGNITIPAKGKTLAFDGGNWVTPPNLPANNMCTDCHAGENAFLNHVGTPLQKAFTDYNTKFPNNNFTTRNAWHTPMVDATWPQNPEAGTYPAGNGLLCSGCHNGTKAGRLPNVAQNLTYDPAPATTVAGGATGGFPTRDNLYKMCSFVLPNEMTTDTTMGAKAGAMSGFNALPDATRLFNACKALNPATNPTTAATWVAAHTMLK